MDQIPDSEIKAIELKLLSQFHNVCVDKGFRYSLCGGTLLGAIRHKGFIPWDDDVDVFMPQPDFERFLEYSQNSNLAFGVMFNGIQPKFYDGFAKVYAKETLLKDEMADFEGVGLGVHLDVCPIKGLGETYQEALRNFKKSSFYRELLVAKNWKHYSRSKTRKWYYEPIRFAFFCLSRIVSGSFLFNRIERCYKEIDFEHSKFAGCLYGAYRKKEIMPIDVFLKYEEMPFENKMFYCTCLYDDYLSNIYGEYMTLPPVEKRVSHHSFKAFYKN